MKFKQFTGSGRFRVAVALLIAALFMVTWVLGSTVMAATGDVFAVGRNFSGGDAFRITAAGTVVTTAPVVLHRTTAATGRAITNTEEIVGVTSTSVARIMYLPPSSTCLPGQEITIKDESGGAASNNIGLYGVDGGSDAIDGASSASITSNYGKITVYTDGAGNWFTR